METFSNDDLHRHRVSQAFRDKKNGEWYEHWAKYYGRRVHSNQQPWQDIQSRLLNYRLYDSSLTPKDIEQICNPRGASGRDHPVNFQHYDIISKRVNAVHTLMSKLNTKYKFYATNPEATTRRSDKEAELLTGSVQAMVVKDLELDLRRSFEEQTKGRELTTEEMEQLEAALMEELQAKTIEETFTYMDRTYKDSGEELANQLANIFEERIEMNAVFDEGKMDILADGHEVYYVGPKGNVPWVFTVNPIYMWYIMSEDCNMLDEADVIVVEYQKTVAEIVRDYDMTDAEIDELYELESKHIVAEHEWQWADNETARERFGIRCVHVVFKSLTKMGFLNYIGADGNMKKDLVNEKYKLNMLAGDIDIEWEWFPEYHEVTMIANKYYKNRGPVKNQLKDVENLYDVRAPYKGAVHRIKNTDPVSMVARLRPWNILLDIILYRADVSLARDRGKKVALNQTALPDDVQKFIDMMDNNDIMLMNPEKIGSMAGDIVNMVKELDLSSAAQVALYHNLADMIDRKAGESVGLTPQIMGLIQEREAVENVRTGLELSSNVLGPMISLHERVKRRVWHGLIEQAKVMYAGKESERIVFWVDDVTRQMLTIDGTLLSETTLGIFARSGTEYYQEKETINQLSIAALQSGKASYAGVLKIKNSDSVRVAQDLLEKEEEEVYRKELEKITLAGEEQRKTIEAQMLADEKTHKREIEKIKIKEVERRKTELAKQMLFSAGFAKDPDINNNNQNDVLEQGKLLLKQAEVEQKRLEMVMSSVEKEKDRNLKREEFKVNERIAKARKPAAKK